MPWTVSEYDISQFHIRQKEGVSVLTYVRTDGRILSEPKLIGCIDNKIFLPMCSAARARTPLIKKQSNRTVITTITN